MTLGRIDRYMLRAITTPLMITLVIAIMLLILEQMLRLFEFVVEANGPIGVVWRMLGNLMPEYLSLALPIGFFLGILMAFRRLSLSSELDALAAGGVSLKRLVRPIMGLAIVLTGVNYLLVAYVEPYSHYRYSQIKFEVRNGALGAKIDVGDFVSVSDEVTLRIGGLSDKRTTGRQVLEDVFLERCDADNRCQAITAKRGAFLASGDENSAILRLYDGRQIDLHPNRLEPDSIQFNVWDIEVTLPGADAFRPRGDNTGEATIGELWAAVRAGPVENAEAYHSSRAALHWRALHTALILVLPFLAAPLGIADHRRDSGLGVVVGLALVILYYELLEASQTLVAESGLSPWLVMWPIYIGLAALSFQMFSTVAEKPGARALSAVEAAWDRVRSGVGRALAAFARVRAT
ncbi:MAG: LPS export ABC transporter permease LptF [Pseudomonadota bacterium]